MTDIPVSTRLFLDAVVNTTSTVAKMFKEFANQIAAQDPQILGAENPLLHAASSKVYSQVLRNLIETEGMAAEELLAYLSPMVIEAPLSTTLVSGAALAVLGVREDAISAIFGIKPPLYEESQTYANQSYHNALVCFMTASATTLANPGRVGPYHPKQIERAKQEAFAAYRMYLQPNSPN